jgi:hypothetical protein
MGLDFKEIASSWFNKLKHNPKQKVLADKRFDICLECPSKKEVIKNQEWSLICDECGCPLKAKVYTPKTYLHKDGSCPLNKWVEIEKKYIEDLRSNKTLL